MRIAIDGQSASGKGAVANLLSIKLGYIHVDTGAFYRMVALKCLSEKINIKNETEVSKILPLIKIEIKYKNGIQQNYLCGELVNTKIRSERVSTASSIISQYKCVREHILDKQRDIANKGNVIMEGRDIGTVVIPSAELKLFLTASPEIRAKRRISQLGLPESEFLNILNDIIERDYRDSTRKLAPLKRAKNSYLIDTSKKNIEEVVEEILDIIKTIE